MPLLDRLINSVFVVDLSGRALGAVRSGFYKDKYGSLIPKRFPGDLFKKISGQATQHHRAMGRAKVLPEMTPDCYVRSHFHSLAVLLHSHLSQEDIPTRAVDNHDVFPHMEEIACFLYFLHGALEVTGATPHVYRRDSLANALKSATGISYLNSAYALVQWVHVAEAYADLKMYAEVIDALEKITDLLGIYVTDKLIHTDFIHRLLPTEELKDILRCYEKLKKTAREGSVKDMNASLVTLENLCLQHGVHFSQEKIQKIRKAGLENGTSGILRLARQHANKLDGSFEKYIHQAREYAMESGTIIEEQEIEKILLDRLDHYLDMAQRYAYHGFWEDMLSMILKFSDYVLYHKIEPGQKRRQRVQDIPDSFNNGTSKKYRLINLLP